MKSTQIFVASRALLLGINALFTLSLMAQALDNPDLVQSFPVGSGPIGVVFDGANIWTINSGSDNVTKLRASDGALQGTFTVGDNPQYGAFDGSNVWVGNFASETVSKLRASDGARDIQRRRHANRGYL
jgi:hypothetical protein